MLTPVELQNKTFKSGGLGYDKKDVEQFFREVTDEYARLYSENIDLKDRVDALNEALQRYKTLEGTLQKALVLAQKTAEDTTQAALKNARNIEKEAQLKSQILMADAKNELERVHTQTLALMQQFEKYKAQFKSLAAAQIELLDSESYSLNADKLEASMDTSYMISRGEERKESVDSMDFSDGLPEFGGLRAPVERVQEREKEKGKRPVRGEEVSVRMQEALNERSARDELKNADRTGSFSGGRPERKQAEKITLEKSAADQRMGKREEVKNQPQTGAAELSANKSEGGSYWPDGRFPGRAIAKSVAFDTKAKPALTEDTDSQENEDPDGFDFIDL
mgnify:CR=1 FL=1